MSNSEEKASLNLSSSKPTPTLKRSGFGFHTFELEDYREFLNRVIPAFCGDRNYIWRGCSDPNWHLVSKLTRKLLPRQKGLEYADWVLESSFLTAKQVFEYLLNLRGIEDLDVDYLELLDALKDKLEGKKKSFADILNDLTKHQRWLIFELFAKGQHHDLATPLLDWTRSPHIALFFAFDEMDKRIDGEGHRVIYALNRAIIEKRVPHSTVVKGDGIMVVESIVHKNPRLIGQAGLFTFSPSHLSIEKWVVDNYRTKSELSELSELPVLFRFLIRNKERNTCLAELELMNIHSRSLFPDLTGAGKATNHLLENK